MRFELMRSKSICLSPQIGRECEFSRQTRWPLRQIDIGFELIPFLSPIYSDNQESIVSWGRSPCIFRRILIGF